MDELQAAKDWIRTRQPYWIVFGGASYATLEQVLHAALDECQVLLITKGVVKISIDVHKDAAPVLIVSLEAVKP